MKVLLALSFVLLTTCTVFSQNKQPYEYSIVQLDSLLEANKTAKTQGSFLPYAQAGVEKAAKEHGKQDTTYARMLYFLGWCYFVIQDMTKATLYYQQAIDIQKIKMPKHSKYAASLNDLGVLYRNTGNYTLAMPLLIQALQLRKEILGEKNAAYSESLNALANLYKDMSNYALAEPLYKEAIKLRKEILGEKNPNYAGSLNNLANLYKDMHNYSLAEPLFQEAIKIFKASVGENNFYYAMSLNNLGILYQEMERGELAEPLFLQSNKLFKEILGENHPYYTMGLNNLSILYQNMVRYELAEPILLESIKLQKKSLNANPSDYATSLNNLAIVYELMNKYKLAEPLYKESLKLYKDVFGTNSQKYIMGLSNLMILYKKTNRQEACWDYAQQSIIANTGLSMSLHICKEWADSLTAINYLSTEHIIVVLANIYQLLALKPSLENQQKQVIIADLAINILKRKRDNFINDTDKLRTLSQSNDWALLSLKVLDKNTQAAKAFLLAEQSKSVLLLDAAKAEQAHSFGDLPDSLIQQELAFQKEHAEYEASLAENRVESEKDSLRSKLNALNLKIKNFKTTIEKSYPKYAALKYQYHEVTVQEIQKLLDDHPSELGTGKTALLEYVVSDSMVYIFYVDNKNLKLLEHAISKKDLTEKIKSLHHVLSDYEFISKKSSEAYKEYTETAHWFYQNLVAPSLANAKDIQHLIIVTDGELGFLPFESFLVEQAPQTVSDYAKLHYLINDYSISYNYSATLWKENSDKPKNKNNGQLLAMASNYETKIDSLKIDWRLPVYQRLRASLNPLPAAQKEVEVLQEQFQGYFALNNLASEKIFKEKAADFAIIHLAMHGILDSKSPILSSLAFTEDGDSLENNFLHAYEISKMNLNADLVVLSACETGYGKFEKGNGVASLARAFMYAGASSLVVSLWQVNDYSTSEVMQNFYANLANGMGKAEALRQAKLDYIKMANGIAAHPAFWSPFIQLGDSRPITIKTQFTVSNLMWAIIILTTFAATFWIWKKRKKSSELHT